MNAINKYPLSTWNRIAFFLYYFSVLRLLKNLSVVYEKQIANFAYIYI